MKEKVLVSACLLGENCKYNGKNNYNECVCEYVKDKEVYAICPEVMGGLGIPRIPCEIVDDKVFNMQKEDTTKAYLQGAQEAVRIAEENNIKKAILKAKRPSCGKGAVYDGTFTHTLIKKDGITVMYLKKLNVEIYTEKEIEELVLINKK